MSVEGRVQGLDHLVCGCLLLPRRRLPELFGCGGNRAAHETVQLTVSSSWRRYWFFKASSWRKKSEEVRKKSISAALLTSTE